MEKDFWLQRWNLNRIGFHQNDVNPWLVEYYSRLGLRPRDRILVPLSGKSRDMLWLAGRGNGVIGVELSPLAVEAFFRENEMVPERREADRFVGYRSGEIELLQGDFFDLSPDDLEGVTAAYDRAAIVALPEGLRRRYAEHLATLLPAGARILMLTFEYPEGSRQGPPFSVTQQEIMKLFADAFEVELLAQKSSEEGGMGEKVFLLQRK
jgi:thiopurine S-methyltransferase